MVLCVFTVMIITGATLSWLVHNNNYVLNSVAILGFSLAVALLMSSYVFWKQKTFAK